ncbi:ATP-grasp fold amidoligase family protein [Longivirga aurantiaca]|uniref:ATP-grasp fold amidoligase family protein n=1 Tax=Longivirga aurantiaca TaxID=1837743 RepID=A0ABW1T3P6_9ACTN
MRSTTRSLAVVRDRLPRRARTALHAVVDARAGLWPTARAYRTLASLAGPEPQGFHDKLLFRLAHDRRPILTTLADRVAVREVVTERVGADRLPTLYGVWDAAGAVPWAELPREVAVKATHGSGGAVLVSDRFARGVELPSRPRSVLWSRYRIHPDDLDVARATGLLRWWLTLGFEHGPNRYPEWAYRDVPHRVLAEELLGTAQVPAREYKLFVADGVVRAIEVLDPDGLGPGVLRDRDWRPLLRSTDAGKPDGEGAAPSTSGEMVALAEELAAGMDMLRVDLYDVDGRVLVGELTSTPSGGRRIFQPDTLDLLLGEHWTLPPEVLANAVATS